VLEVRRATWAADDVTALLTDLEIGLCNIDQPLFHRSTKPRAEATSRIGYVRLPWAELLELVFEDRSFASVMTIYARRTRSVGWPMREVATHTDDTCVVTNNQHLARHC
jgi:hypothetical protein